MIMLFRRKEILDQINEELKRFDSESSEKDPARTIAATRDKVTIKEIRKVGNGAYVVRTRMPDENGKSVSTDLSFTVTEHTFTSSKGYSVDVMESIASVLVAIRLFNETHR